MRSVWTAATSFGVMTVSAILAGSGALAGCNYDNPGFKVKGTAEGGGDSETGASVSGTSGDTSVASTPTTTTTTTDDPTLTSFTVSAGSVTDPTTTAPGTESGLSTGPLLPWDNTCDTPIWSEFRPAVADTYFFHSYAAGESNCYFTDQPLSEDYECIDLNAGAVDYLPMVFTDIVMGDPKFYLQALLGARFSLDGLEDGGEQVPRAAVVSSALELYFFRGNPQLVWGPPEFDLYALAAAGDEVVLWPEGEHFAPGGCSKGEPSFRCLACGATPKGACDLDWKTPGSVYVPGQSKLITHFDLGAKTADGVQLKDIELDLAATDYALDTGVLVVATTKLQWNDQLELKSVNYDNGAVGPFLKVQYCPNPN